MHALREFVCAQSIHTSSRSLISMTHTMYPSDPAHVPSTFLTSSECRCVSRFCPRNFGDNSMSCSMIRVKNMTPKQRTPSLTDTHTHTLSASHTHTTKRRDHCTTTTTPNTSVILSLTALSTTSCSTRRECELRLHSLFVLTLTLGIREPSTERSPKGRGALI